jgi:hypothetical protein
LPPVWLAAALVLLGTGLQLIRGPGVPVWRAVFGEDGGIFLTEALASRGWSGLLTPYQGYVQLISRLVAGFTAFFPLAAAAVVLAVTSALLVSLLSLFVYVRSRALLVSTWSRAVVAIAPVLLPAGSEINASATNLHWYLDYACFWALVAPVRRRRTAVAAGLVAAVAMLSDPLAGLFLPLAVARAWPVLRTLVRRRQVGAEQVGAEPPETQPAGRVIELVVPAAFGLAAVLQLLLGVARQHADSFQSARPADLPAIYGLRVAGSFLLGDRFLPRLFSDWGLPFAFGCLAVVAAGVVLASARRWQRPLLLTAVAFSVVWLGIPLLLRGTSTLLDRGSSDLPGSRYMVVPVLLLIVALAARLDGPLGDPQPAAAAEPGRHRTRDARFLATLVLVVIALASWSIPSQREKGPVWSDTLQAAKQRCAATGNDPAEVGRSAEAPWGLPAGPGDVLVPVAPGGPHPGWSVVASCRQL